MVDLLTKDLNSYRMGAHNFYGPGPDYEAVKCGRISYLPTMF